MPRKEFSRKVRREVIERANGKCERCHAILKTGEGEIDHILPDALGGQPIAINARLLCKVCHQAKTQADVRRIRKSDRVRDKASGALRTRTPLLRKANKQSSVSKNMPPRRGGIAAQYQIGEE